MKASPLALLLCAAVASAQPADDAAAHHRRGLKLLTESPKDYAAAAAAFAAAYRLDPEPKYLFNLALAQRLGGHCREAIESYRAYLAVEPPPVNADNARIGIERCEQMLGAEAVQPADRQPADRQPADASPADTLPADTRRADPTPADRTPAAPLAHSPARERDRLGTGLLLGGGGAAAASLTLYLLARSAASATFEPGSLGDYEANRDRASRFGAASWITAGASAALVTAAVIRFATRRRPADVTVAPTAGGAGVLIGGSF